MNELERDDPEVWSALKCGDFVAAKSKVPFTSLFTDQTLEQEIKKLKQHGGMIGLSQSEVAPDRLLVTTPRLANLIKRYLSGFPRHSQPSERAEHYQLSGQVAVGTNWNTHKMRASIEQYCEGNPFTQNTPLKNISSSY